MNRGREARVAEQVEKLRGLSGASNAFLAPQPAELIVSQDNEKILQIHRREIVIVFLRPARLHDLYQDHRARGSSRLNILREYHGTLGPLVAQFEGTLDQFSCDGIIHGT